MVPTAWGRGGHQPRVASRSFSSICRTSSPRMASPNSSCASSTAFGSSKCVVAFTTALARAKAVVKATTHFEDPKAVLEAHEELGEAMRGLDVRQMEEK